MQGEVRGLEPGLVVGVGREDLRGGTFEGAKTGETGYGANADRRLRTLYGKQTDMGLAELRQSATLPKQAKIMHILENVHRGLARIHEIT